MKPTGYRRKGIASLPVSIFFVALVATAFVGASALTSGQSGLTSKQISAENTLAARQQELTGLAASTTGNGLLQLTQSSGAATTVVYAIAQTAMGQTFTEPVSYVVETGQTTDVNFTSLLLSMFSGTLPSSLSSVTLVTSRGLYITSSVQTLQQTRQVTTYQQEQVQKTGQRLSGYDVAETTSVVAGYNVIQTSTVNQLAGYDVTAHYPVTVQVLSGYDLYQTVAHTAYTCPSGWTNYQDGLCSYTYSYTTYTTQTTYETRYVSLSGYLCWITTHNIGCVIGGSLRGCPAWWEVCVAVTFPVTEVVAVVHYVTVYTDAYATYYMFQVISPIGTTSGSGWYRSGSAAPYSIGATSSGGPLVFQRFSGWTGSFTSGQASGSTIITAPESITAQWSTDNALLFAAVGMALGVAAVAGLLVFRLRKKSAPS